MDVDHVRGLPEAETTRPASVGRSASVIITGAAAGGIGEAEAEYFADAGDFVVLNDVDESGLDSVVRQLGGSEVAVAVPGDITQSQTAQNLVAAATEHGRRLVTVINNAGADAHGMIWDLADHDWDRVVDVSARGTFVLSREAARYWRSQAGAHGPSRVNLINTTSRAGLLGNPGQVGYSSAKAAVASMTQSLARELEQFGVRCNGIAPLAYTKMMRDAIGEFDPSAIPAWSPKHIARFVGFLCGPGGNGINGQVFVVRGTHIQLARPWSLTAEVELDHDGGTDSVLDRVMSLFGGEPAMILGFQLGGWPTAQPVRNPFLVTGPAE